MNAREVYEGRLGFLSGYHGRVTWRQACSIGWYYRLGWLSGDQFRGVLTRVGAAERLKIEWPKRVEG